MWSEKEYMIEGSNGNRKTVCSSSPLSHPDFYNTLKFLELSVKSTVHEKEFNDPNKYHANGTSTREETKSDLKISFIK